MVDMQIAPRPRIGHILRSMQTERPGLGLKASPPQGGLRSFLGLGLGMNLGPAVAGLVCGAAGGVAAATLDYVRALQEISRHLQKGQGAAQVWAFLACLYGGVGALSGLLVALALVLLVRVSILGSFLRADSQKDPAESGKPVHGRPLPLWAVATSAVVAAAGLGAALYGPASFALQRFHHRVLIALLMGAAAAGLALPFCGLGLLILSGLSALSGQGPKVRPGLRGPRVLYLAGLLLGGILLGGADGIFFLRLQGNPRMTPHLRALNLALWTPLLALCCLGLGHLAGRALSARAGGSAALRRGLRPPEVQALVLLAVPTLPVLGVLLAYWDTLRILDLRPITSLLLALIVALAVHFVAARLRAARLAPAHSANPSGLLWHRRAVALLMLQQLLWSGAHFFGRSDRVRKAALSQAPLAGPLLGGMQQVFDLDRDGFPSRFVAGGTDCDDLDPEVHPGAFDWPDDGIDQNCNGHQATLPSETLSPWPARPPGLPDRPNVVLITIDALRADHVGVYGYPRPTTPVLDALARESFLFRNGWAHAPSTRYSVPAILTGRYPSTLAWGSPMQHWPPEVLPENRLISEMLRARGYHTIALLSYHYFEPTWGLSRGFDDYDVHLMTLHSMGGDPAATSGTSSRELADLAIGRIAAQVQYPEKPFFLWVHFYDPHYRYEVHPGIPVFGTGQNEEDLYDGEIRYTDQHIGRVLAALRESGAWDRTVIAITADHGEGFEEHGIPRDRRHGYHLYANQTKVPFILHVPGSALGPAREIDAPVGHVDLLPTLLNLCGGQAQDEPRLAGHSLLGLLLGQEDGAARRVFQEVMYEGPTERKAVVTRRWHYIRNVIPDGTGELYDLQADADEKHDQQGLPGTALAERDLSLALAEWMDESAIPPDFRRRVAGNLSTSPPALEPGQKNIRGVLGGWLGIESAGVRRAQVSRGDAAELVVVLKGIARGETGWRLFTHLTSQKGAFVNADHDPLEGLLPPPRIRPGQYVRDVVKIPLPADFPTGPAFVDIGLYHVGHAGERAPVSGLAPFVNPPDRVVRVATVEVR